MRQQSSSAGTSAGWAIERWCLARIARLFAGVPVRLELWDGTRAELSTAPAVATIHVHDFTTLVRLLARPDLAFGEGYTAGRLTVQGDLVELFEVMNRALAGRWPLRPAAVAAAASPASARHNVHAHYDLGNDFYRLWLDEAMVYTCAYFERDDMSLEEAQRAKLDYVCRKLRLQPGEHVIEAGCGWGALALHMARRYGVTVRACNISEPQLAYARERAAAEGLADRIEFRNEDYRSIGGRADAFVSIGMVEHVGRDQYGELGRAIDRVLDPDHGRGLLHFIGRNLPMEFNAWTARYIFPGAHAPALGEVMTGIFEPFELSVVDVENLRLHYALTLAHWLARFERHAEAVARMFDESFVRTWRLYLAGSQAGFRSGDLQLYQVAFARPRDNAQPRTRAALYGAPADGSR